MRHVRYYAPYLLLGVAVHIAIPDSGWRGPVVSGILSAALAIVDNR